MNTDTKTITDRVIAVDFGISLQTMITAGKYDWVNPNITAEKFPVEGSEQTRSSFRGVAA